MAITHDYLNTVGYKPTIVEANVGELIPNLADGTLWSKNPSGEIVLVGNTLIYTEVEIGSDLNSLSPDIGDTALRRDNGRTYKYVSDGTTNVWLDIGAGNNIGVVTTVKRNISVIAIEKNSSIPGGTDTIGAIEIPFDGNIIEIRAKTYSGICDVIFKNNGFTLGTVSATTLGISNTTLSNTGISTWDDLTIDIENPAGTGLTITVILQEQ